MLNVIFKLILRVYIYNHVIPKKIYNTICKVQQKNICLTYTNSNIMLERFWMNMSYLRERSLSRKGIKR